MQRPRVGGAVIYARYSPDLGAEICRRIAAGEVWAHMARRGRMPNPGAIYEWRKRYPAFAEALAQAREIAADGGRDLPTNLETLGEDLMKDDLMTPAPRRLRNKSRRADGGVEYVRYTEAAVRRICDGLAAGKTWKSLSSLPKMPSHSTFFDWRRKHPEFDHAVRVARAIAAEDRFEEAYETSVGSTMETLAKDKAHVDLCMKQAAALDPSQFSERGRGAAGRPGEGGGHVQTFVIRHFEKVIEEDGTSRLLAFDRVQQVER
ncbi:hypothetical protein [Phenylobacterium sp. J367]|uniref:terminase small subunit-like protein n=1 Tax=Phenylobacterium sp. J367 TaxID=2898435 RepID=UPI0021508ADE|nr:hypothetical protein [Phenylobacterium sp. J367]MCR5879411.1 hypothetical protein [Phenylobacterium sp. J367]